MVVEQNYPKVLVGCPTSFYKGYCLDKYAVAVKSLDYPNFDILLVDNSNDGGVYMQKIKELGLPVIEGPWFESARDRIVACRNLLAKKAIEGGYDYLFSLEQDVLPPQYALKKLVDADKKVISAVYFARNLMTDGQVRLIPLVYKLVDKNNLDMVPLGDEELWDNPKVMKVVSAGLGCVLLHKDILKKVKFRYEKDSEVFDDRWFFIDLHKLGVEVFADTKIRCKHIIFNRPYQWKDIKK
ncbi:MAG: glycosyltransferase family 2 protein [Nanoarchaeota archaeon]|nr:glycosyltransferase family 2 protein [Nanoarchaeota archaeon]